MSSYQSLASWTNPPTRETWYNRPGTSPYELNMNVSVEQGPAWGPKGSVYRKELSKKAKTVLSISISAVALILFLLLLYYFTHSYSQAVYYF